MINNYTDIMYSRIQQRKDRLACVYSKTVNQGNHKCNKLKKLKIVAINSIYRKFFTSDIIAGGIFKFWAVGKMSENLCLIMQNLALKNQPQFWGNSGAELKF